MDIISLREYISLNEDIFHWTNWYRQFLEMNIIACQNIIASNDYTLCEEIYVIWKNQYFFES